MRYVLEGTGTVTYAGQDFAVSPNTLVRVDAGTADEAVLQWACDEACDELLLLTPEYRGPPLLPVAAAFLVACVVLVLAAQPAGAMTPSGVDALPEAQQAAVFAYIYAALCASAYGSAAAYEAARRALPSRLWDAWEAFSAAAIGATLLVAGTSHFTMPAAFEAIYPPAGTWGFWYLPADAHFHVAWTGGAELLGGGGLLLSCLLTHLGGPPDPDPEQPYASGLLASSARAVLALVLAVTPANVYMFTHGALMPGVVETDLALGWHAGRFAAQAVVLSVLLTLSAVGPSSRRLQTSERGPDTR